EYSAMLAHLSVATKVYRSAAVLAVIVVVFSLCGLYLYRRERLLLANTKRLVVMLALLVLTVSLARLVSFDPWRAELLPILLFGQMTAIAYRQELGLLLSGAVALILVIGLGMGISEFITLFVVTATAVLQVGHIRSRSRLIYIGFFSALVAVLLTIVATVTMSQPLSWPLLEEALRNGAWALAAGFIMTGLLPFIEKLFGVLTDMSLLELGDVAHPLLQELVRRAPSTYNHSITMGSVAEAAADAIGARGLLVRVGAYYHDIGKMLKPGYFIENQGKDEENRLETLVPTMSTLVIIAHIKDGAKLARQHHLPEPIIDFIQQHHGTTLVGYFYDRASRQSKDDPHGTSVEESSFRYPGPKPQTKEAAVMMLADAVESASRTLVDPTPARIESLVRQISERRLDDGQFDESGLTLRELRTIEKSMVKSVTAIYHGRVKYPDHKGSGNGKGKGGNGKRKGENGKHRVDNPEKTGDKDDGDAESGGGEDRGQ
ncbi:MAG: HDIG domain-containing protein, partial [Planctomycetota bacterium]|nr:HDIG domain-containing protein [Planctomycetota bacterium]